jgi:hypothetical protein
MLIDLILYFRSTLLSFRERVNIFVNLVVTIIVTFYFLASENIPLSSVLVVTFGAVIAVTYHCLMLLLGRIRWIFKSTITRGYLRLDAWSLALAFDSCRWIPPMILCLAFRNGDISFERMFSEVIPWLYTIWAMCGIVSILFMALSLLFEVTWRSEIIQIQSKGEKSGASIN